MGCNCNNKIVVPTVNQALNGLKSVVKMINPNNIADEEIIKLRRDICRICEFATKNPDLGLTNFSQCTKCSCVIKLKTSHKESTCPLEKW